jgi:hypothetical protein
LTFEKAKPIAMKYFLVIFLMILGCDRVSLDNNYETINVAGEIFQVAKQDFPRRLNWWEAVNACKNLGNGWRLPYEYELSMMKVQLHNHGKGDFKNEDYWSLSVSEVYFFSMEF